ncbi:MAG TPA: hypothetical protein VH916_06600 [Dehalococcoidia bacterium]|jgi:hypothetical protein
MQITKMIRTNQYSSAIHHHPDALVAAVRYGARAGSAHPNRHIHTRERRQAERHGP